MRFLKVAALGLLLPAIADLPAAAIEPLPVEEVAPGIFVHHGRHEMATAENFGGIANLGFIVGAQAVGVVDTGGSLAQGQALLAAIRRITDLPIRYVINTHFHPDHIFGNAAFRGEAVTFVAHARLPRALAARAESYMKGLQQALGAAAAGTDIVMPDRLIETEEVIDLGGRPLLLTAYPPAHTEADLTITDLTTQTLFAGDLVFLERIPVIDGSIRGWLQVTDEMRRRDVARVVAGHGPVSAAWPSALEGQTRYLGRLLRQMRIFLSAGGGLEKAIDTLGIEERDQWQLFEQYHGRNVTAAYTELEWE